MTLGDIIEEMSKGDSESLKILCPGSDQTWYSLSVTKHHGASYLNGLVEEMGSSQLPESLKDEAISGMDEEELRSALPSILLASFGVESKES
jgi:hypothetical protein